MFRRTRFASGLILLAALSLSFAQGVSLSMCGPAMTSGHPEGDGDEMEGMVMGDAPMDHDCPPGHGHDASEPADAAPCPFALPGASQGCAVAASLPAGGTVIEIPSPRVVATVGLTQVRHSFLGIASIFRPPKA